MRHIVLASAMAFGLAAPALAQDKPAQEAPAAPTTYDAPIVNNKGDTIGKIAIPRRRQHPGDAGDDPARRPAGRLARHPLPRGRQLRRYRQVPESKAHVNHDNAKHGLLHPKGRTRATCRTSLPPPTAR